MSKKNLPIKVVLQKKSDTQKNPGGGETKFFGAFTYELQEQIINKFSDIQEYYKSLFDENSDIPAIGKITVKKEAIAKSHKPNALCKKCSIIGGNDLDEIYIKLTKNSINETITLIKENASEKLRANLTTISDIQPFKPQEKISSNLQLCSNQTDFSSVKDKIKIKFFNFVNEEDNTKILKYIYEKLNELGFNNKYELITYGETIKYIKIETKSYDDIIKIYSINGIKMIDFFQQYSLPDEKTSPLEVSELLNDEEYIDSDISIGIIDGGLSDTNPYLQPYIMSRKEYVPKPYQNHEHGTFIASMIQYGNVLNNIPSPAPIRFKFVDIIAIPNSNKEYGETDVISEEQLMEIIEEVMKEYGSTTKIWNMSLGIDSKICNGNMSDLGIFLDYIQDKYKVQFFVSSGNLRVPPFREWPINSEIEIEDRIVSPADSIRAISVGALALYDSADSIVKCNEPSPFSRRGPGANYIVKPDVVDYGGNISTSHSSSDLGVKSLDVDGNIAEGIGTSYSTPRIVQKFASIYDEMIDNDLLLSKALLIHSARMNSRELLDENQDNIKYYGFGMPSTFTQDILQCSDDEITLVFKQEVTPGFHLEMFDFPFPPSLIYDNKYHGEIGMTLVYNTILDENYGMEYCRVNIDVGFGSYKMRENASPDYHSEVPLEASWDEKFEKARVRNGFKWSPVKSYYRNIKNGIIAKDGWKIRIDMTPRNGLLMTSTQEFVLIVTIKDPNGSDIYSEIVNGLQERGYITNNLETRYQVRQRQ